MGKPLAAFAAWRCFQAGRLSPHKRQATGILQAEGLEISYIKKAAPFQERPAEAGDQQAPHFTLRETASSKKA